MATLSADLKPCDFFVWGYMKSKVWQTSPKTLPELKIAVTSAVHTIACNVCSRVMDGFQNRLTAVPFREGFRTPLSIIAFSIVSIYITEIFSSLLFVLKFRFVSNIYFWATLYLN
ncbi:hypothetical protein AVEN_161428-1 [Araneus ventricosus]|uniref:Uncharacterized protein n=1 Tax=Araneus ventricosus TaxID=182803 RepID=A0A4Y2KA65_ARAVE|nr:hypothetical protein AVEN_161428-1 [Araneus ventricosus]